MVRKLDEKQKEAIMACQAQFEKRGMNNSNAVENLRKSEVTIHIHVPAHTNVQVSR